MYAWSRVLISPSSFLLEFSVVVILNNVEISSASYLPISGTLDVDYIHRLGFVCFEMSKMVSFKRI